MHSIKNFEQLKKNLKEDFSLLPTIKIAVTGDSSTQFLVQAIRGAGFEEKLNFEIFEADFDQVEMQVLDPFSDLYKSNPDFILIFESSNKLWKKFASRSPSEKSGFSTGHLNTVSSFCTAISENSKAKLIYVNLQELDDRVFGNFSNKTSQSFLYQVRKINCGLMELSSSFRDLFILDLSFLSSRGGSAFCFDPRMYYSAEMNLSLDVLPLLAKNFTDIVLSINGKFKKCLVLDLDNTVWGGIIGDDGIEKIEIGHLGTGKIYSELQTWAKQLKERGIILAVCSKNEESVAMEPFLKHPDMVLRPEDIAVFVANWNNKAENLKYIQSVLNIGFDSMVFLDDNPFERNLVRQFLPEITVPELPEDPAHYLQYLIGLNLFETASYSEEDTVRTQQYREEAERTRYKTSFINENDYLQNLEMESEVRPFDKFNIPRIAQLSQRSNQFNLRTIRYTEEEIKKLSDSEKHITLSFSLNDKYGKNGLICVVILSIEQDELFIDTWLMSCRVLKRGMENFTFNTIMKKAAEMGIKKIKGEYIPTSKNMMVKEHYAQLGFELRGNMWEYTLENFAEKECFIKAI